jgi:hypothetical protein
MKAIIWHNKIKLNASKFNCLPITTTEFNSIKRL